MNFVHIVVRSLWNIDNPEIAHLSNYRRLSLRKRLFFLKYAREFEHQMKQPVAASHRIQFLDLTLDSKNPSLRKKAMIAPLNEIR